MLMVISMDDEELLRKINTNFSEKRLSLNKQDLLFLSGKQNYFGKIHGVFTRDYWKRETLIKAGEIYYAYTFKTYIGDFNIERAYPSWILFSPQNEIQKNPKIYRQIAVKMQEVLKNLKKLKGNEKTLKNILKSDLEEPHYFEIPAPYNLGYLCYLSICYVRPHHFFNFKMGINLVIARQTISKEIIYLPELYWIEEYKAKYADRTVEEKEQKDESKEKNI